MARPYVGQRPFLPADRDRFWGRATEAAALARWWQDNRLTYVVGEAGCGKTSLLNAGVLPLLDTDKVTVLPVGRPSLHDVKRLHLLVVGREEAVQVVGNTLGGGSKHEIAKLGRSGATQAITRPMATMGRTFADGAAEKLVTDLQTSIIAGTTAAGRYVTGDWVDPSLLQVACAHFADSLAHRDVPVTVGDVRRYADLDTALAVHLGAIVAEVADDHDLVQKELRLWLLRTFVTDLGTRGKAYEGTATTAGMPNAVARTLEDRHVLIARPDSGGRWYELLSDRLIQPLREVTHVSPPPPQPARYLRLAEHALTLGQLDLAERYARETMRCPLLSSRQFQAEAHSLLGSLCYEREKPQEAEKFYRDAMEQFEAASNTRMVALQLAAVGQVLLCQGRFAKAAEVLRGAATRAPGDLVIRVAYAGALWLLGAGRAAVAELTIALGIDGSDAAALRTRGEILADLGKPVDALRDLDRVASSGSFLVAAARALALAELGDHRTARRAAEKVADDGAHNDGPALLYAARTFALCGDAGRAADLARQATDAGDPPLDPPHEEIARRLIDRDRGQPPA